MQKCLISIRSHTHKYMYNSHSDGIRRQLDAKPEAVDMAHYYTPWDAARIISTFQNFNIFKIFCQQKYFVYGQVISNLCSPFHSTCVLCICLYTYLIGLLLYKSLL